MLNYSNRKFAKLISEDEVYLVSNAIKKTKNLRTQSWWTNRDMVDRSFDKVLVIGDDNPIAKITVDALKSVDSLATFTYGIGTSLNNEQIKPFDKNVQIDKKTVTLLSANCDNIAVADEWLGFAEDVFNRINSKGGICVVSIMLPDFPDLSGGIEALSEREFDAHLRMIAEPTPEQQYFLNIEKLCRRASKEFGTKIILVRMANIFGAKCYNVHNWDIESLIKDIAKSKEVSIVEQDFVLNQSLTYIVDAASIVFHLLYNGVPGHIYNYASCTTTMAKIKLVLHDYFSGILSLKASSPSIKIVKFRALSTIKIAQSRYKSKLGPEDILCRVFCAETEYQFIDKNNKTIYIGKLDRIKELEMEILREVDRICEKYNLKYFLAAGTLLGAKRYGHNIPWDDDLDIAILRKDFQKFRKIVQKELNSKFEYCCYYNDAKSHYLVDKIRVRNTWFSTKFSSINRMPDGVFLDILVYDATSDYKPLAWLHNKLAWAFQCYIYLAWRHLRRRDFKSVAFWLIYRAMSLLPLHFWHWIFEREVTLFSFKRHPKFFIDGLGARAGGKLIPAEGLFETTRIPFDEGFMACAPKNPEGYLQFAYGKNYLAEPPISEQHGHALARIDLGDNISKDMAGGVLPPVDLRGELFE